MVMTMMVYELERVATEGWYFRNDLDGPTGEERDERRQRAIVLSRALRARLTDVYGPEDKNLVPYAPVSS